MVLMLKCLINESGIAILCRFFSLQASARIRIKLEQHQSLEQEAKLR